jgi:hypothetical protein
MTDAKARLLLVDDDAGQLSELHDRIRERLDGLDVAIDLWRPSFETPVREELIKQLKPRPTLVVTDHDLTENGAAGLFGGTIISWCRAHAIPVGDYSRKLSEDLEEPDMFEFRFESEPAKAAEEIAELFLGFRQLGEMLTGGPQQEMDSWSQSLATALGREQAASSFSLYSVRAGASHVDAIDRLQKEVGEEEARRLLEIYVVGHLLRNGVLRYAGPIMGEDVLCSYLAISEENGDKVADLFTAARYEGPFGQRKRYFWQEDVDDVLADLAEESGFEGDIGDDQFRRQLMQAHLDPGAHKCPRCEGVRGGFRCPYTNRTTCERADCSVPSTSWVPQGAYLTRVEKNYYERWAPLLGL